VANHYNLCDWVVAWHADRFVEDSQGVIESNVVSLIDARDVYPTKPEKNACFKWNTKKLRKEVRMFDIAKRAQAKQFLGIIFK
jgi:hypothetical protein